MQALAKATPTLADCTVYGVGFQIPVLWDSTCRDHQAHQDPKVTKVSKGAAKKAVRSRSKAGSQSPKSDQHIFIGAKALRGRKEKLKGGGCKDTQFLPKGSLWYH